jgi:hypothetical protein
MTMTSLSSATVGGGRCLGSNLAPEEIIMKFGRILSEVAAEIERQARMKQDYVADTRQLRLAQDGQTTATVASRRRT